ncbi:tetratricopeptide repeat protein [Chloroflexi bacterium TSY]|nr:tetratricopeptide repeat protein [Chloroflexi bacterium TSY]
MSETQFSLDALIVDLQAATTSAEKAAVVAELSFTDLDDIAAAVARRCTILHWFDESVIAVLLTDLLPDITDEALLTRAAELYSQLQQYLFIEQVSPNQLAYHDLTHEGLIARYAESDPDLLRTGARLAARAYLARKDNEASAGEALYCLVLAGEPEQATELLDEMLQRADGREDWQAFVSILGLRDEAEQYAFVESLPRTPYHHLVSGIAYSDLGDLSAAISDYDQAISLNPNYATAYYNRGNTYYDLGDLSAAISDYDQAISLNPNYATAYYNRGNTYYNLGDLSAAISDYDQAISLNPNYATAYYKRGIAYRDLGDMITAIVDYDQAISLNPSYATAYYKRGIAYCVQGDIIGAIADYDQAISLNPDFAMAYSDRGDAYCDQGDLSAAIADYDQAIKLAIHLPDKGAQAYNNRGNAHRDLGDLSAAISDYDQAISLNPDFATAYYNRGNVHRAKGDLSAAISDYDQAISLNLDYALVQSNRGDALRRLEQWEEALAAYRQSVDLDADRFWDWVALAAVGRHAGNEAVREEAIEQARRLVDPDDAYNMACVESIAGNREKALNLLAEALEKNPNQVDWARQDPDLLWLHDEPRFWELVGRADGGDESGWTELTFREEIGH